MKPPAALMLAGIQGNESCPARTDIQKNEVFQASANLVHKKCGQGVENHVYKLNRKPLYNHLSYMHKKCALFLPFKIKQLPNILHSNYI